MLEQGRGESGESFKIFMPVVVIPEHAHAAGWFIRSQKRVAEHFKSVTSRAG